MFGTPINQKTVTLKLKRTEVCDLLLACAAISKSLDESGEKNEKWTDLHDKLKAILEDFDKKQEVSNNG